MQTKDVLTEIAPFLSRAVSVLVEATNDSNVAVLVYPVPISDPLCWGIMLDGEDYGPYNFEQLVVALHSHRLTGSSYDLDEACPDEELQSAAELELRKLARALAEKHQEYNSAIAHVGYNSWNIVVDGEYDSDMNLEELLRRVSTS